MYISGEIFIMISSFCLVGCTIADVWRRYVLHGWYPKYREDFLGFRSISGTKIYEDTIGSY